MEEMKIEANVNGRYYTLEELEEEARLDAQEKEILARKGMRKDDTTINARVNREKWEMLKLMVQLGWVKNLRTGLDEALEMYIQDVQLRKRKERYVSPEYAVKLAEVAVEETEEAGGVDEAEVTGGKGEEPLAVTSAADKEGEEKVKAAGENEEGW